VDRLRERLDIAARALATFTELVGRNRALSLTERDAAHVRFAYNFEAIWKVAQRHLAVQGGIEVASSKACIRAARLAGHLADDQAEDALRMADDPNLIVHTYNESLAAEIAARLPRHAEILAAWPGAMRANPG